MPQYLSQFEVLSEAIVPPLDDANTPFVIQGYFLLISRLPDAHGGEFPVKLVFTPTPAFPPIGNPTVPPPPNVPAPNVIVDIEDDTGTSKFIVPDPNTVAQFTVNVGSGKTILFGIQPNIINFAAGGPFDPTPTTGGTFGVRGYVTIDYGPSASASGTYQLAVTPEIRATFLTVAKGGTAASPTYTPNFMNVSATAYALPTTSGPLISITKPKEIIKEADGKVLKDIKDTGIGVKGIKDGVQQEVGGGTEVSGLAQRVAAIEDLLGMGAAFIGSDDRPPVG